MSIGQLLASLGVPEAAAGDTTVQTRISLYNEGQLRDLLDIGLSPQQRAEHANALLDGISVPADSPHVALLHRLVRHAVGNDELSGSDRAELAPAYPLTAHIFAQEAPIPPMRVNYIWDVSTPDGSLKVIDLPNGIELLDGGCIVARSTPLHFTCSTFTRTGGPPAGYKGDFNILGTTGRPVLTPLPPPDPGQAPAGAPGQCSSGGIAGEGGGPGSPGLQGTTGFPGGRGNDGIASSLATIAITDKLTLDGATTHFLLVATQSGVGGTGGTGGQGSRGQQGGNGGDGVSCGCTGNGGGAAGPGGRGGTGGPAGDGGNGVDAAGSIAVYLPPLVSTNAVQPVPSPALPGQPGSPGGGGPGGMPGNPGAAGKHNSAGATSGSGPTGDFGATGNPGTHTGVPAQVIPRNR